MSLVQHLHDVLLEDSSDGSSNSVPVEVLSIAMCVIYAGITGLSLWLFWRAYEVHRRSADEEMRSLVSSEAVDQAFQTCQGVNNQHIERISAPKTPTQSTAFICHTYTSPNPSNGCGSPSEKHLSQGTLTSQSPQNSPTIKTTVESGGAQSPSNKERDSCDADLLGSRGNYNNNNNNNSNANNRATMCSNSSFGAQSDASENEKISAKEFFYVGTKRWSETSGMQTGGQKNGENARKSLKESSKGIFYYGTNLANIEGLPTAANPTNHESNPSSGKRKMSCTEMLKSWLTNLLPFYFLCFILSASRSVMWGLSAETRVLMKEKVQLTFFILPSLIYLIMLSFLVSTWWYAFSSIAAFHSNTDFEDYKIPKLMYIGYVLEVGILAFFLYCVCLDTDVTNHHQDEVLWAMSAAFFVMAVIIGWIGWQMWRGLSDLPYSFRGLGLLKKRVKRIYIAVVPSLLLRAFFSAIQMIHITDNFDNFVQGNYFVFIFYFFLEVLPIVFLLRCLSMKKKKNNTTNNPHDCEKHPQLPTNPTRTEENIFRKSSSSPALGLNLTGCKKTIAVPSNPVVQDIPYERVGSSLTNLHSPTQFATHIDLSKSYGDQFLSASKQHKYLKDSVEHKQITSHSTTHEKR